VNKRFNRERGSTRRLWLGLVAIGGVLLIPIAGLKHNMAGAESSSTVVDASKLHPRAVAAKQLKARNDYLMSKQGFAHGVPAGAFANAIQQVNEEASEGTLRKLSKAELAATFAWQPLGPDPINLLTFFTTGVEFGSPHTGAGAFTALAVDSNPADNPGSSHYLIFAGSADGGVYLSADGGLTFTQVFNGEPTEAIGAIAIDTTTTPSTVYVGTGNPNGNFDSYYGEGVFRSTDLGSTWSPNIMPASFAAGAVAVSKIALDPANKIIFVSATWGTSSDRAGASNLTAVDQTQAGLWVSQDDGNTFAQYPVSALGDCNIDNDPCPVDDVEIDPATNNSGSHNVYVAVDAEGGAPLATGAGGVFRSTNEGLSGGILGTFTAVLGTATLSRSSIVIGSQLAGAAASQAYFMVGDNTGGAYDGLYYSSDGTSLTKETVPSFTAGSPSVTFDGTSDNNQANSFYAQALAIDPNLPNSIFFGGVGLYSSGNHGGSWTSLINNQSSSSQGPAANQHAMAFDASTGVMLLADDGGLYSFSPTALSNVTFNSLNTTIDTTLVQTVGPHPTNNSLVWAGFEGAGTEQYNGTVTNPNSNWVFPTSEAGDGGFVMYDPSNNGYVYHTYSNDNLDTNVSFAYSSNGGNTWTSGTPSTKGTPSYNLTQALIANGDTGAAFYPPIAVDPTTPHRVFFGAHSLYVSNDGGTTWVAQTPFDLTGNPNGDGTWGLEDIEPVSHSNGWALSMADPLLQFPFLLTNATDLNLDTTGGAAGGVTWSAAPTQSLPFDFTATQATGIAVDHSDPTGNTAYLTLGGFYGGAAGDGVGHIYQTIDFGSTWVEDDGGTASSNPPLTALPDVPVLRVLADTAGPFDSNGRTLTLYAATDIGVFKSSDQGQTWGQFNLPSAVSAAGTLQAVPVFDIEENQNNTIFIGTHGKGVFQLVAAVPTPTPSIAPTPSATPTPAAVNGVLTISPASITFPTEAFGQTGATSPPKTIKISNPKKKNQPSITIESVIPLSTSSGSYTTQNDGCTGQTLAPGSPACTVNVLYTPLSASKSTSTVTVNSNSLTKPALNVKVSGTGALVSITAKPTTLNFGKVTIGTPSSALTTTLANKNNVPVSITGETPGGKTFGDYAVDPNTTTCGSLPATLNANSSCNVGVIFTPGAKGSRAATLTISGTIKSPVTIKLSGTGLTP
jgi:hypothetical protein